MFLWTSCIQKVWSSGRGQSSLEAKLLLFSIYFILKFDVAVCCCCLLLLFVVVVVVDDACFPSQVNAVVYQDLCGND